MNQSVLTNIRKALVHLYYDTPSIRRVAQDAGIDLSNVNLYSNPQNNWNAVLEEADKTGEMDSLLAVAETDYKKNRELAKAIDAYRRARGAGDELLSPAPGHNSGNTGSAQSASTQLGREQKMQLTYALLECPSMADPHSRETIVQQLPAAWSGRVRRSTRALEDTLNIVEICSRYANGIESLCEIVHFFEGDSIPLKNVEALVSELLSQSLSSEQESAISSIQPSTPAEPEDKSDGVVDFEKILLQNRYLIFDQVYEQASDQASERASITHIAFDRQRGKSVILQSLPWNDATALTQFETNAQRFLHLAHPNLIPVTDYFILDTGPYRGLYLVMDFVEGETVAAFIHEPEQMLSDPEMLEYILQVCAATQYLHNQSPPLIHGDITPSHISIDRPRKRAVLTHLGVAALISPPAVRMSSQVIARCPIINPGYTPIEQYESVFGGTQLSDIYAVGAVWYALLTGQVPPDSSRRITGKAHLLPVGQFNPRVNSGVNNALRQALAIDPAKRPPSMADWTQSLRALFDRQISPYQTQCEHLEKLLVSGQWQDADRETTRIVQAILDEGRQKGNRIDAFPCIALQLINGLWEEYSNGRYGFRTQATIWQESTGYRGEFQNPQLRTFGEQVDWFADGTWLDHNQMQFDGRAVDGHLPTLLSTGEADGIGSEAASRDRVRNMLARAAECLAV